LTDVNVILTVTDTRTGAGRERLRDLSVKDGDPPRREEVQSFSRESMAST